MYEIRVIETNEPGQRLGLCKTLKIAKKLAKDKAHDYHYGTVIIDMTTGLYDFGDGDGWCEWPSK